MIMTDLYREYQLDFGRPLKTALAIPFDESQVTRGEGNTLRISALKVTFTSKKTKKSALNEYTVKVYNLNEDQLQWISSFRSEEVYTSMKIRYLGTDPEAAPDYDTLFVGSIQSIDTRKEGQDRVTKLTIKDGYTNVKEAITSRSYPRGTSYKTVFEGLRTDLGLPKGTVQLPEGLKTPSPWAYSGSTFEGFKVLGLELGYDTYINDSTINFVAQDEINLTTIRLYNATSGLIGDVTPFDNSSGSKQKNTKEQKVGIRFKVLCNPVLKPNTLVQIESRDFTGTYKITKITHKGDTRGNDWYSECQAVEINATVTRFAVDYNNFSR